jgi:hypothetical protein
MFGRHEEQQGADDERVRVDAVLEGDVGHVEESVAEYLQGQTDAARRSLVAALDKLDDQTDQSDAYENSVVGSGALGYASMGEVLGETSIDPIVDEVPNAELHAQIALVQAAKEEVRRPTPETLAALHASQAALAATREQSPGGR